MTRYLALLAACAMSASCLSGGSLASRPGAIHAVVATEGAALRQIRLGNFEVTDITLLAAHRRGAFADGKVGPTIAHVGFTLRGPNDVPWIATCERRDHPADHGVDLTSSTLVDHSYAEIECVYHPQDSAERQRWHMRVFTREGNFWQNNEVSGELLPADVSKAQGSAGFSVSGKTETWNLQPLVAGAGWRDPTVVGALELRPEVMSYVDPGLSPDQKRAVSMLFATALTFDHIATTPATAPVMVGTTRPTVVKQIAISLSQLCALRDDGGVWCASGHGFIDPQVSGAVQIAVGDANGGGYGCAALADGGAQCWAMGSRGDVLGMGNFMTALPGAERVYGVSNIAQVASTSDGRTCALRRDGTVLCWGKDGATPGVVAGVADVAQIGWTHNACDGLGGRLKDGTLRRLVYATSDPGCARTDGGLMQSYLVHGASLQGLTDFVSGHDYSCALGPDGAVMCWGYGKDEVLKFTAELGSSRDPQRVPELHDVTQLAGGERHACALVRGGTVMCWGSNGDGQLGDGGKRDRALPGQVPGLTDAAQIAAGGSLTCAVRASGSVVCWGRGPVWSDGVRAPQALNLP